MQLYTPGLRKLSDAAQAFVSFAKAFVRAHDPNTLDSDSVVTLAPAPDNSSDDPGH